MGMKRKQIVLSALFTLFLVSSELICTCKSVTFQEDTFLTKQQSLALLKFKNRMFRQLNQDFMKEDLYLIRWLRAKNFDIPRAEEFLKTHLKWRKENNMDTIHQEDWSDFKEYPYDFPGQDREGRQIIQFDIGLWDVRKTVVSGKSKRLYRYINKIWDEGRMRIYELGLQGKNVTRWTMIADMSNINAVQHVNAGGIPFFLSAAASYEANFPGLGDKIFLINTPGIFETVLALVRPMLSNHTRNALQVYGKDREKWRPDVVAAMNPALLPVHYGGTKIAN